MDFLDIGGDVYAVWPILHDWGQAAFQVRKVGRGAETYSVLLNGALSSCDCRGFEAHGHCKHLSSVQALTQGR